MSLHDHVGGPQWAAAMKDKQPTEKKVADKWARATINTAESVEMLRAIWPSHHRAMVSAVQRDIREALHHLEAAWHLLDHITEDVMGADFDDVVNYPDLVQSSNIVDHINQVRSDDAAGS